jgi:hypothetical protein
MLGGVVVSPLAESIDSLNPEPDMAAPRKQNFTLAQLALMEWLVEKTNRVVSSGSAGINVGSYHTLSEIGEPDAFGRSPVNYVLSSFGKDDHDFLRRLGGKIPDMHPLSAAGYLNHYMEMGAGPRAEKFFAKIQERGFGYTDHVFVPNPAGREWWESDGAALLAMKRQDEAVRRADVERVVLVGQKATVEPTVSDQLKRMTPHWLRIPLPNRKAVVPAFLATVVKETPARVYVENVRNVALGPGFAVAWSDHPLKARSPNAYVEPASIMAHHATDALAAAAVEIATALQRNVTAEADRLLTQIVPLILGVSRDIEQHSARHDDLMRDLLTAHAAKVDQAETQDDATSEVRPKGI